MTDARYNEFLRVAEEAACKAGQHTLDNLHRRTDVAEAFAHDVKLKLDLECQRIAEDVIHGHYPDHSILGEEGTKDRDNDEFEWIVDPIDGTVNFSHGIPPWCSSVALRHGEEVVAGAVYVAPLGELYTACAGQPALCNGDPIAPSDVKAASQALILTGLSKKLDSASAAFAEFKRITLGVQKVRVMGAAAVDICHVACGRADAYIESSIYLWDVAAAGLIARQAGARTAVLEQYTDTHLSYLCTTPDIFEEIRGLLG